MEPNDPPKERHVTADPTSIGDDAENVMIHLVIPNEHAAEFIARLKRICELTRLDSSDLRDATDTQLLAAMFDSYTEHILEVLEKRASERAKQNAEAEKNPKAPSEEHGGVE